MNPAPPRIRPQENRRDEDGAVLILFALLLVGVFGLLGAVVDGGRLRLTKQQLDAGAESAALEGVRFKDREDDATRRARAIATTGLQWDDDLNPSNGDALGLGAGTLPIVAGAQPLGGTLLVSTATAPRRWKPEGQLQLNLGNAVYGDLVAGTHVPGALPSEDETFQRTDFIPVSQGGTSSEFSSASSFLVRLRRTNGRSALDRQLGESSSGPAFEWLWARGSAWQEPSVGGSQQGRTEGLTVRATAIAATERALTVSDTPGGDPLLAEIALRADSTSAWNTTAPGTALTLDYGANGELLLAGIEEGVALSSRVRTVGASLMPILPAPADVPPTEFIVPVYGFISGERRVIGFTLATVTDSGASLTVIRQPAAVLPAGASSVSLPALDARVALELTPELRVLHAAFTEPVLAPVLRR